MVPHPLALRLDPSRSIRDQIYEAAQMGARGVVIPCVDDLAPHRLGDTGRRDLRRLVRTTELTLVGLGLPVRRPFDRTDQLDERIRRADQTFAMAYELGTNLVIATVGDVPPREEAERHAAFTNALTTLGARADHQGVRLALEAVTQPGHVLADFLAALDTMSLGASVNPSALLRSGEDPGTATRELGRWVAHAYVPGHSGAAHSGPRWEPGGHGVDWEEYLGALEEVGYRGFLTLWPEPTEDVRARLTGVIQRLKRM